MTKTNTKHRFIAIITALAVILTAFVGLYPFEPLKAEATAPVSNTATWDLTGASASAGPNGGHYSGTYDWDGTNTLTLNSFAFQTTADPAIKVPAGTTIVLSGINHIVSTAVNGAAIESAGDLTIKGSGSVELNCGVAASQLKVEGSVNVIISGTKTGAAALNIDIASSATVTWNAEYAGNVFLDSLISLTGTGTFSMTGGKVENTLNGSAIDNSSTGKITISGTAEITSAGNYTISLRNGVLGVTVLDIQGGKVENTGSGTAIRNTGAGNITVNGGTVTASDGTGIYMANNAVLFVENGEITARIGIDTQNNSIAVISGGTVNGTTYAAQLLENSSLYLWGSAVIDGTIIRGATAVTAKAYYIGGYLGKFDISGTHKFTQETNLFDLAAAAVTANSAAHTGATPTAHDVVATLSDKLDLSTATVTASAGSPAVDKTANTVTFSQNGNINPTITVTGAKIAGFTVPAFTTAAFGVNIDKAPPTLGGTATISGTNAIGQTLTVNTTAITGGSGAFSYQWKADGSNIGTSSYNYELTGAEAGKAITCIITRADATGSVPATFDSGAVVPFNITVTNIGNVSGDTAVSLLDTTGRNGDPITLNYALGDVSGSKPINALNFTGVTGLTNLTAKGQSTSQVYTVNSSDAVNGVITITATFTHNDLTAYRVDFGVTGDNGTLWAKVDMEPILSGYSIQEGKSVVFTAYPDNGYRVKQWTLNSVPVTDNTTKTYTLSNLSAAAIVTVEFEVCTSHDFSDGTGHCIICFYTCMHEGFTAGTATDCTAAQVCGICNKKGVASTNTSHKLSAVWTERTAPTCGVAGLEFRKCFHCEYEETQPIPAKGHTPGAAATCTTPQTCLHCTHEITAALGHTAGAAATCTTSQTCLHCTHEITAALGHNWATNNDGTHNCTRVGGCGTINEACSPYGTAGNICAKCFYVTPTGGGGMAGGFGQLPPGAPNPTNKTDSEQNIIFSIGDINRDGMINASDALEILKALVGIIELDPIQKLATSSRGDGKFTATDALNILKYVAGIIDTL